MAERNKSILFTIPKNIPNIKTSYTGNMAILFQNEQKRLKVGWVIRYISKGLLLDVKLNRKYFPILNWE